jgi:hypothetical protein
VSAIKAPSGTPISAAMSAAARGGALENKTSIGKSKFERRKAVRFAGIDTWIVSREDRVPKPSFKNM